MLVAGRPRRDDARAIEEALEIWQTIGDEAELANAYYNASFTYAVNVGFGPTDVADGRPETRACRYLETARDIFRRIGDRRGEANALWGLGNYRYFRESPGTAIEQFRETLEIFRRGRRPDDGGLGAAHARDRRCSATGTSTRRGRHRARDPPLPCRRRRGRV